MLAHELKTIWKDPEFNLLLKLSTMLGFRNPTWVVTWDAIKSGNKPRADVAPIIQEELGLPNLVSLSIEV